MSMRAQSLLFSFFFLSFNERVLLAVLSNIFLCNLGRHNDLQRDILILFFLSLKGLGHEIRIALKWCGSIGLG